MGTEQLADLLEQLGIRCRLETLGRMLLVVPLDDWSPLRQAALRRQLLTAARQAGFTHVALEIGITRSDASISSGQPA